MLPGWFLNAVYVLLAYQWDSSSLKVIFTNPLLLFNICHPFRSFFHGEIPLKITCSRLQLIIMPYLSSSLFCSSRHNYFREFLNSVIKTTISIVCYSSFLVTVQCQEVGKTDILNQHHVPVELPTQHILKCNILKIKQNYIIVHILGALFGFHLSCNEKQLVLIWILWQSCR